MRIVHLTPFYFPSVGGYQTKIRALSERLARRGHEVWIVTTAAQAGESFTMPKQREDVPSGGPTSLGGVSIERLRYVTVPAPIQYIMDGCMDFWWRHRLWPNEAVRNLWLGPHMIAMMRTLERIAPDVILAGPLPFYTPYAGLRAARRLEIPCAVIPCLHPLQAWEFDNRLHYKLLSEADVVLPSTEYELQWASSMGARMKKVCILGDGVDPQALAGGDRAEFRRTHGIDDKELVVLFIGRLEPDKGAIHLLEAAKLIRQKESAVTFVFGGLQTAAWKKAIAAFGTDKKIVEIGRFDDAAKPGILAAADVVALPSRAESTGLVFLEAWSCSLPVIGCCTGAVREVVEDCTDGLLVPFGDVEALAHSIVDLAGDAGRRTALGRAGRDKAARKYDWSALTDRLEGVYRELIGEGG